MALRFRVRNVGESTIVRATATPPSTPRLFPLRLRFASVWHTGSALVKASMKAGVSWLFERSSVTRAGESGGSTALGLGLGLNATAVPAPAVEDLTGAGESSTAG